MIHVKHPKPEMNSNQEEFLTHWPDDKRRFHELLFSLGNATYRYHTRAQEFKPTQQDWEQWLEGLPENIRDDFRRQGFEASKTVLSFTRYVMEKNDVGMEEYVRKLMGEDAYKEYQITIEK